MRELKVLGVPDAITIRFGQVDGDRVQVRADLSMHALATVPAKKATPEVVTELATRVAALLTEAVDQALHPLDEPPARAQEAKPA